MKKIYIILALVAMTGFCLFGNSLMNTMAQEPQPAHIERLYTSLEIQKGDSLWSIANEYSQSGNISVSDYIKELKNMNNLKEDTIHAGQYLTVVYFSSGAEE